MIIFFTREKHNANSELQTHCIHAVHQNLSSPRLKDTNITLSIA